MEHVPTMSSLDNAEKGLYEKISERYETAHAAFRAFAEKGNALSIDNVKSMIDRLVCVRIDRNDLNTLVRKMGNGGPIRYHAFRKYVNALESKFGNGPSHQQENRAEQVCRDSIFSTVLCVYAACSFSVPSLQTLYIEMWIPHFSSHLDLSHRLRFYSWGVWVEMKK